MQHVYAGDWAGVAELYALSADNSPAPAPISDLPDNTIHQPST